MRTGKGERIYSPVSSNFSISSQVSTIVGLSSGCKVSPLQLCSYSKAFLYITFPKSLLTLFVGSHGPVHQEEVNVSYIKVLQRDIKALLDRAMVFSTVKLSMIKLKG